MKNRKKQKQGQNYKANIWGTHAVREALLNPQRQIRSFYITEQTAKHFEIPQSAPDPVVMDRKSMDRMLPQGAVHQGLALDIDFLEDVFIQDFIVESSNRKKTVLLMLDQVTDPHNVGAIIRSACALGADGIIMQKKHAPSLTGVLAKTSCGAIEHIPVAFETNLTRSLETLQDNGFFALGLDENGETEIGDTAMPDKCVLVLGAEGSGIRRLIREQCDILVRLPTAGPILSLNVSNAAAVALYELGKQKSPNKKSQPV